MFEAYIPDGTVTQIVNQMISDHHTSGHPLLLGNSIQIITFTSMHDNDILANFMVSIFLNIIWSNCPTSSIFILPVAAMVLSLTLSSTVVPVNY